MKLETVNLSKRFNREWIFKGFDFTFTCGNTYAIIGPNGSGKSTLLQVLWGQMPPTSGSILYSNTEVNINLEKIHQHVSIATPYMDLIDEFTLQEQLEFHFKLKKSRDGMSIENILERMYLEKAKDKFISNFSSGMKQRLKLGLAFFTQANMIFLDEPGTNLDLQTFDWYLAQLQSLPTDCIVFIASNQSAEYPAHAHKIDILSYK